MPISGHDDDAKSDLKLLPWIVHFPYLGYQVIIKTNFVYFCLKSFLTNQMRLCQSQFVTFSPMSNDLLIGAYERARELS